MTFPRLIAIDLDGTLLDATGRISGRSVQALRAAGSSGRIVVIATGRPPFMVDDVVASVGATITHVVAANGAIITSAHDGSILRQVMIDAPLARTTVTVLRQWVPGIGFALATDMGFAHEPGFAERMPAVVPTAATTDVLTLGGTEVRKLMAFHPDIAADDLAQHVAARLPENIEARHMGADAIEVGPAGVDKASGLSWLCDQLGVDRTDVLAFGDESNDISMLTWAGHGVAMANATDAVKAVADEIAPSNIDHGVAHVLERLPQQ
jgi:Cof subfamily protein (haloacid dehalogenase superfamily)